MTFGEVGMEGLTGKVNDRMTIGIFPLSLWGNDLNTTSLCSFSDNLWRQEDFCFSPTSFLFSSSNSSWKQKKK